MNEMLGALTVFGGSLTALCALLAVWAWRRSAAAVESRRALREAAGGEGPARWLRVFPGGAKGPLDACLRGDRLSWHDPGSGGAGLETQVVSEARWVGDATGEAGLQLETEGGTLTVTGLLDLTRACAALSATGVPFRNALPDGAAPTSPKRVAALHVKEREMLQQWMVPGERLVDLVPRVAHRGSGPATGLGKSGFGTLVVTNLRFGLLVRTVTVQVQGNVRRQSTQVQLAGYPFPAYQQVTVERDLALRAERVWWSAEMRPDAGLPTDAKRPAVRLRADHGIALLPQTSCRLPMELEEPAPALGRLLAELLVGALLFGALGAALGGGAFAAYWGMGSGTWWMEDWIPIVAAGGALAGVLTGALGTLEAYWARCAEVASAGAAA